MLPTLFAVVITFVCLYGPYQGIRFVTDPEDALVVTAVLSFAVGGPSMAKHKSMEVMERLNKEDSDDLDEDDVEMYKNAAKTIYYIMSIEKAMKQP